MAFDASKTARNIDLGNTTKEEAFQNLTGAQKGAVNKALKVREEVKKQEEEDAREIAAMTEEERMASCMALVNR